MIGAWRLILALMVVNAHLFQPWWPGAFAVFSFYLISGFLMTVILNEQYSFSPRGLGFFWLNRILRIFPSYYFACLLSIFLIFLFSAGAVSEINGHLVLPESWTEILTNIFIVGLRDWPAERSLLVPPGWTLYIELFYYLIISLWAGRSRWNAYLFLAMGILHLVYVYLFKEGVFWERYFFIKAGALPFAVGVVLYFHLQQCKKIINWFTWKNSFAAATCLYASFWVFVSNAENPLNVFLYVNLILSAALLAVLWHAPVSRWKKLDKLMGDLSYPVYLLHWQAGVIVILTTGYAAKSISAYALGLVLTLILSYFELLVVTQPVERLRRANKRRLAEMATLNTQYLSGNAVNELLTRHSKLSG